MGYPPLDGGQQFARENIFVGVFPFKAKACIYGERYSLVAFVDGHNPSLTPAPEQGTSV